MIKVSSRLEALGIARAYLGDTKKDESASNKAGYPICKNISGEWVSDLGNRLELNFADGHTQNIWIEDELKGIERFTNQKRVAVYYQHKGEEVRKSTFSKISHCTVETGRQPRFVVYFVTGWGQIECASFLISTILSIQYE